MGSPDACPLPVGAPGEALDAFRQAQDPLADELGSIRRRSSRSCSGSIPQDPTLQLTGKPLRGYRLLERVEGAFGVVWRARPRAGAGGRREAIHPRLSDDPSFVRRFEQEAQTIARLEHPHVVPLYDYWRDGSGAYLVMRWMRGGPSRTSSCAQARPRALGEDRRPARGCARPRTEPTRSTATSSRPTSCSTTTGTPTCRTSASRRI